MATRIKEQLPLRLQYSANGHTELRDAAAADNKNLPVHRWVPWIAGFSAQFVQDAIDTYLPKRNREHHVVLDPFAGVGTTLVEALKAGCHAVGYEINPFAALAARAKVNCVDTNQRTLRTKVESFRFDLFKFETQVDRKWLSAGEKSVRSIISSLASNQPAAFKSRIPFFSPPIEAKFLYALDRIASFREPYRSLFQSALGATMVSFSNYTYEPSLSSRPGAGKPLIDNASVARVVSQKLETILEDTALVIAQYGSIWKSRRRDVLASSYLSSLLPKQEVSLLITSPPYMNNYHYVRNTRPQLHWLGLMKPSESLRGYEEESFGKFWQTVRQGPTVGLDVSLPSLEELIRKLQGLSLDRGQYGGPGWANYVATYFNDCDRFLTQVKGHLRPGARAVIVVGNSIIQGIEFKVDELLAELAETRGLTVEEVLMVRKKRVGNSIIDSAVRNGHTTPHKGRTQLYDAAVILRR
jgi:SAM-dependent methyltransferase